MSQMSHKKGSKLSQEEQELLGYFNKSYELKLTEDALLKPTRDIILEIFHKFLDEVKSDWQNTENWKNYQEDSYKAHLLIEIYKWIKYFIRVFDKIGVRYQDVLLPEKKRVFQILNYLAYIRLNMIERIMPEWYGLCEKASSRNAERQKLNQLIEQLRLENEEMTLRMAEPLEVLEQRLREARKEFECSQNIGVELASSAQKDKKRAQELSDQIATEQASLKSAELWVQKWSEFAKDQVFIKNIDKRALITEETLKALVDFEQKLINMKLEMSTMNKTFEGEVFEGRQSEKRSIEFWRALIIGARKEVEMKLKIEEAKKHSIEQENQLREKRSTDDKLKHSIITVRENCVDIENQLAPKLASLENQGKESDDVRNREILELEQIVASTHTKLEDAGNNHKDKIAKLDAEKGRSEYLLARFMKQHEEASNKIEAKRKSSCF